ncbi:MAG: glutamate synthase subunit beta [Ignavibacteria bacterium]|nr:glutamate synthase subunit beta [Ignavibacteria bacterium]
MGEIRGFVKYNRQELEKQKAPERTKHWGEFTVLPSEEDIRKQGARCMDCGVPFCSSGCPINNIIPDWNDLVYKGRWKEAITRLHRTNNFPEFTGRVCPAPCENSCTLAINRPAVSIKNIEVTIIERAYKEGWITPKPPLFRTGFKVAVIGSGPSGLACADQINKEGHFVTVFEKNEKPGGLLTFGIPEFKLEKKIVERRINLMKEEGIEFRCGVNAGKDIPAENLIKEFDVIVLCGGSETPRNLEVPGRELEGVYYAMEFLTQQNRINLGLLNEKDNKISAKGKNVIVIGGGDTGSDCIGTSIRQGAKSVRNFELLPKPPKTRQPDNPWPQWALIERISTSHEEGCEREFAVLTKKLTGSSGKVEKLHGIRLEFGAKDPLTGRSPMNEIPGSEFKLETDMVILAMGFTGPVKTGLIEQLGVELDNRGNVKTGADYMTSRSGVFAAGDMRRGQSLVVWAINEGRNAAASVNNYLAQKEKQ